MNASKASRLELYPDFDSASADGGREVGIAILDEAEPVGVRPTAEGRDAAVIDGG